ncbi:Uncharacterised protein [Mycobacteroides abscessus subsp. abscessus]|nr:Uncharacterised protein [Mycobacteroides abscessus subsp. abscessus]
MVVVVGGVVVVVVGGGGGGGSGDGGGGCTDCVTVWVCGGGGGSGDGGGSAGASPVLGTTLTLGVVVAGAGDSLLVSDTIIPVKAIPATAAAAMNHTSGRRYQGSGG